MTLQVEPFFLQQLQFVQFMTVLTDPGLAYMMHCTGRKETHHLNFCSKTQIPRKVFGTWLLTMTATVGAALLACNLQRTSISCAPSIGYTEVWRRKRSFCRVCEWAMPRSRSVCSVRTCVDSCVCVQTCVCVCVRVYLCWYSCACWGRGCCGCGRAGSCDFIPH